MNLTSDGSGDCLDPLTAYIQGGSRVPHGLCSRAVPGREGAGGRNFDFSRRANGDLEQENVCIKRRVEVCTSAYCRSSHGVRRCGHCKNLAQPFEGIQCFKLEEDVVITNLDADNYKNLAKKLVGKAQVIVAEPRPLHSTSARHHPSSLPPSSSAHFATVEHTSVELKPQVFALGHPFALAITLALAISHHILAQPAHFAAVELSLLHYRRARPLCIRAQPSGPSPPPELASTSSPALMAPNKLKASTSSISSKSKSSSSKCNNPLTLQSPTERKMTGGDATLTGERGRNKIKQLPLKKQNLKPALSTSLALSASKQAGP
ncbi:uncharacterized protein A4U43_C03F1960 [Asparagus officinalis]|uniref:Uncharacterized protein n=1 Tax=Asparagus officinalis TaxID=4686 RepID=A0A5P1FB25_ASPOF|nr:uncharacterized protein A4U43_C03F1960 [Asparagus officinalis]